MTENNAQPNKFLNFLLENLALKNDAALARTLDVAPPVISKIRHGRLAIGASLIISAHEVSGISIRKLKAAAGLKSAKSAVPDEY